VPAAFKLTEDSSNPVATVVGVSGSLDLFTAPALRRVVERVVEVHARALVVDLTATTALDSTGLGVLVAAHRQVLGRMVVVATQAATLDVLRATGLDHLLALASSRQEAMAVCADSSLQLGAVGILQRHGPGGRFGTTRVA
jgi:anti-sigma B factor antagonist